MLSCVNRWLQVFLSKKIHELLPFIKVIFKRRFKLMNAGEWRFLINVFKACKQRLQQYLFS